MLPWIKLALFMFLAPHLLIPVATAAADDREGELRSKDTMDSLLRSLFQERATRPLEAPLAHPKARISPSFHLLRVTGAKATFGPTETVEDLRAQDESMDADPKNKFKYVRELRKQFQAKNKFNYEKYE
jgi:hypothetical protein